MAKIALQLRLEEETHSKLKEIADKELRSLNAQIEYFILKGIENFYSDSESSEKAPPHKI